MPNAYRKNHRLADVLALIQLLAIAKKAQRSDGGIETAIQTPKSCRKWSALAAEHPEFFRVANGDKYPLSLIARHSAASNDDNGKERAPLSTEFVQALMNTAIDLHDRADASRLLVRHGSILVGVGGLLVAAISLLVSAWCT